ncbi:hypothetical protein EDB89DRAFT_2245668 [Lactarius sanguifluus]|nr:hypothetical protein EDB89DRAFT_2245668 [Lactarius sanguifluus]
MGYSIVVTDRMPLILRHQGHSRTIVGYEITRDGATDLLVFDPSVHPDVRLNESKYNRVQHVVKSLKESFRSTKTGMSPPQVCTDTVTVLRSDRIPVLSGMTTSLSSKTQI